MAIGIASKRTKSKLKGESHWWGFADLPIGVSYPNYAEGLPDESGEEDCLTFICQINLKDIATLDSEAILPHKGMLWFFASLDYFLGDLDAECEGIGEWRRESFKVLFSPEDSELSTHEVYFEDGSLATLEPEAMTFKPVDDRAAGHRLLGEPFYDETASETQGLISLLQLDEQESWGLRFFDMGILNFMITPEDLRERRFDRVRLYMHSL